MFTLCENKYELTRTGRHVIFGELYMICEAIDFLEGFINVNNKSTRLFDTILTSYSKITEDILENNLCIYGSQFKVDGLSEEYIMNIPKEKYSSWQRLKNISHLIIEVCELSLLPELTNLIVDFIWLHM